MIHSWRSLLTLSLLLLLPMAMSAQQLEFSHPHGFYTEPFVLTITQQDGQPADGLDIHYTLDGSWPTTNSPRYQQPLTINRTTILRAAVVTADTIGTVTTATYLFTADILRQSNSPAGYPKEWGAFTTISGTAKADYEMDPEMTGDKQLAKKIVEGLTDLPVLSIVTDKDYLFSHECDSVRGGIYIFTGPPVGDPTGHGWTRPASVELFGGQQQHDLSTDCGLRLHGGHGRLAEKNPKHSFRLVFKKQYGPSTLNYPIFGSDEPSQFNQLVVRCHFGNSWQHWMDSGRQKAQYTRDVWARRMLRKMGHTSVNALYVNLFLNGMYWGLYNVAERVDDLFGKDHLGGKKSDIDVIKIEEDGGNHIEASEGSLDAWDQLADMAAKAADNTYYQRLQGHLPDGSDDPQQEALLDIDHFIDYMLINQYGGNTDWDHHNWYAIRRRGADSQGFRLLCWDSEQLFENVKENVLSKNNGNRFPTGIFNNLMKNDYFALRYLRRAKVLLADDGLLGQESVVELWDSLYHHISKAIYAEAARWGDYRRDVHRYSSAGELYTVDGHYMTERNRLLNEYFPYRSQRVLSNISSIVHVDDWEVPEEWTQLTASMFHEWDGSGADASPLDKTVNVDWNMGVDVGSGGAIAGFVNVDQNCFADLQGFGKLVLRGTGGRLRILANRLEAHGPYKQITVTFDSSDPYWDSDLDAIVFDLSDLKSTPTNEGKTRNDSFVHLNALKVDWGNTVNVKAAYLIPSADGVVAIRPTLSDDDNYYNLQGQQVTHPTRGIYIHRGKKMVVR